MSGDPQYLDVLSGEIGSLQRKQNKNKIKLTESLKGNKVEKNYTRLWIVNYSRNNIK
jgi:hypothetical protein